jgi:hypothetical protein
MRGVRAFATIGMSALAALTPFDAAAGQLLAEAHAPALPVASLALRAAAVALVLLGALLVFWGWLRRENALGRSAPPAPEPGVDADWLERNVLSLPPELVGTACDQRVGAPEVAAVLARMCGESKLASRVAAGTRGWNNLELWLLVDREELGGYERELVDALFGSSRTTSADLIQQQHHSRGFEPAALLRHPLRAACDRALGIRPARRWPLVLALGAVVLGLALTLRADTSVIVPVLLSAGAGAIGPLSGILIFAPRYRRDPTQPASSARACVASAGASILALALLIATLPSLPPLVPLSLAAWGLLGAVLVASAAASREGTGGLALRRNLLVARRFLAAELERPVPRLRDEWLPYLIALELSAQVDHWYQAYGRIETAARREVTERAESAEGTPLWTGGAGGLGGVGPSGPWIAATAGLTVATRRERAPLPAHDRKLALGVPA